jgi:hypothetical protein
VLPLEDNIIPAFPKSPAAKEHKGFKLNAGIILMLEAG